MTTIAVLYVFTQLALIVVKLASNVGVPMFATPIPWDNVPNANYYSVVVALDNVQNVG